MKILSLNGLNEDINTTVANAAKITNINQGDMNALVNLNQKYNTNIDKIATVNKIRSLHISFVNKIAYKKYLRGINNYILTDNDVINNLLFTFITYYDNDSVYLYPYVKQDAPLMKLEDILENGNPKYLKLSLSTRNSLNAKINVKNYFNEFTNERTNQNYNNVLNFKLIIGSDFDIINKKYNITNNNLLNLKNIDNQTHYINFTNVSGEKTINNKYDNISEKFVSYKIQFSPYIINGYTNPNSTNTIINSFNNEFDGLKLHTLRIQPNSSRVIPQTPELLNINFYNNYKIINIFTRKGANNTYIICLPNNINNYINRLNVDIEGFIVSKNRANNTFSVVSVKLKIVKV
jgi:hypothetical protein